MYKQKIEGNTIAKGVIFLKIKKAVGYFISFFSLSILFSACYYFSYKNALRQFNENAVQRNQELIMSLEDKGLIADSDIEKEPLMEDNENHNVASQEEDDEVSTPVDIVQDTILPSTVYKLQVYDMKNGTMAEDILPIPSYLIGLDRVETLEYLYEYMHDLPLSEFEKGLISFELISFSKDDILLRKTYNEDKVENQYFLISQNGYIVVYYGDRKTVYEYTGLSTNGLTQFEKMQLEEGVFAKDLDELYALLENYSS